MNFITQIIINSLIAGALCALMTISFNVIYGVTKFFNFAHGAIAISAGYMVLYLTKTLNTPVFLAIIIGILVAGVFGFLSEILIFRSLRNKGSSKSILLVASIGLLAVIQGIIAIIFTSDFKTLWQIKLIGDSYKLWGGNISGIQLILIFSALLVMVLVFLILKFTQFGKKVRAINDDFEVAKITGINTDKITCIVLFAASAVAGLAGIFNAYDTGLQPNIGLSLLLKGVIAAIIGGTGSVAGGVIGAFVLSFVENIAIWNISAEWKDVISFSVLILFLIIRPQGFIKQ